MSEIDVPHAYRLIHLFGAPLISYISGDEVVPTDPEQMSQGLPPNVNQALAKLDELKQYAATNSQPLIFMVSQAALRGYFDDLRAELGGELAELSSDDPVVATLNTVLRHLSTLILTTPHLYLTESSPFAVQFLGLYDRDLERNFQVAVEADPVLRTLLEIAASEDWDKEQLEFRKEFDVRSLLDSLLRSCYITARLRHTTQLPDMAQIASELLQAAREACSRGIATVSYFAVMNGIGIQQNLKAGAIDAYALTDVCPDIVAPQDRPAINGTTGQPMGYALEVKHRRRYKRGNDLLFSQGEPQDARDLDRELGSVPLAFALAAGLSANAAWASVVDVVLGGAMPSFLRADAGTIRPGYLTNSQESEVVDWLNLLGRLGAARRNKVRIAERRLVTAISERNQPADRLIDAVIVWESLFGNNQELSFRTSMGLAFLVGGTEADIEGLRRRIKGIYDIRSKVVHGSIDIDDKRIAESADEAIDIALRAMKRMYRDASQLIDLDSAERTMSVILRRMRENEATT